MKRTVLFALAVSGLMMQACAQRGDEPQQAPARVQPQQQADVTRLAITDFTDVASATIDAVVHIKTEMEQLTPLYQSFFGFIIQQGVQRQTYSAYGSGVIITTDGYIVTNQHVVKGATSVSVTLYNGQTYPAAVVGGDSDYDVAVLKIEATGLQAVTLGSSAELNVGDTILAIGNPLGELTFSMSKGIVSCCDRAINVDGTPFKMIQVDASINPGNSGGPLMNLYGEVVGIVSAKYSSYASTTVEGLGFAIPMSSACFVVNDLIAKGEFEGVPTIGITVVTTGGENGETRLEVYSVEPGFGAVDAGVQEGDIILAADGQPITQTSDLLKVRRSHVIGDTIVLTVLRGEETLELPVVLYSNKGR